MIRALKGGAGATRPNIAAPSACGKLTWRYTASLYFSCLQPANTRRKGGQLKSAVLIPEPISDVIT